jgi:hypothetical protein
MPALSTIHIDQGLTNISIMYRNPAYIGEQVLPVLPVNKRSNKYFVYQKEDFIATPLQDAQGRPLSLRAPGTEAAEIGYRVSTSNYSAEEYAKRTIVTDAELAIADSPLQPDVDATVLLTENLLMDNENAIANKVMGIANYNSGSKVALTTGSSGTSYAQYASANSNPFIDIKNAKIQIISQIVREPNRYLASVSAARTLADHPLVKDLVKYTQQDALTTSGLPKTLRGLQVLEGYQQKNTAGEGLTYSGGNVWQASDGSQAVLIYYSNPNPSPRSVTFGYTFEAPDDTTGQRGLVIRKWREEKRKGFLVEASFLRDWRFIALDGSGLAIGGYLVTSATV